ncbi:MAG: response regulator transcription factor [Dehalococcoidia bacterium]|nr:response regulator transcription factor [Dehalococcoidia bacterium]MDP7085355.1 response regulator transcription factor [Dehalococcoidia bacterium]MDP7202400.1 response regulator transcription factor [Dehalococcoidia bacterium]MDP7509818.1 response regulator transcription factor [Dehalococcoidia bacterium]
MLVVDDHPKAREMLATMILSYDDKLDIQSIYEAASGEDATQLARDYQPHVVLMDIRMPGIDGFEAARIIKEECPSAAILMMTAVEEPGQRQVAADLGAAGFITKDRVGTELVPMLSSLLGQPATER